MPQTKFEVKGPSGFGEEDFLRNVHADADADTDADADADVGQLWMTIAQLS